MSSAANRAVRWYDYLTINIYWLGLTGIAQTMTPLVVPLLVQQFVGEQLKGTFYGTLRLWTLMVAVLVQSLMGLVSDHSTFRMGRRRPFILLGGTLDLVLMAFIGLTAGLEGTTGFFILFVLTILLSIASNTGQAAQQGLIPDLVPDHLRGRFSGVKAIFEVPLPLVLIPFTVGRLISRGKYWEGILLTMAVVLITMLVTMLVPEQPARRPAQKIDLKPLLRLALMTAIFTLVILCLGGLLRWIGALTSTIENTTTLILVTGLTGLIAMLLAVGFGVVFSIRAGLGIEAAHQKSYTAWVVNRLAFLVGATNLGSFAIYFLQARLGLIREQAAGPASLLMMFVGLFILLSALPSGMLSDRFGRRQMVAFSGLTAAAGTAVAVASPSLLFIYAGGIIIGVGTGLFFASNWALGTSLVPHDKAGQYLGISNLAGAGAGAIGAYLGGPIADQISRQVPQLTGAGYVLLFVIYGLMFLFSVIPLRWVSEPRPEEPDPQPIQISQPV